MKYITFSILLLLLLVPVINADIIKRGPNWGDEKQPNGQHNIEIYAGPINFLENGVYVPIDPTIKSDIDGHFVDKGIYKARWYKDSSVRIEKDGFYISYKDKNMKINSLKKSIKNNSEKSILKNKLKYHESYSNVDVEYQYLPTKFKQNYIIKSPISSPGDIVAFNGTLKFSPELEVYVDGERKEGNFETKSSIELKSEGNIVFRILPPYITDFNNQFIFGRYLAVKNGNNLELSLIVPPEWLSDSRRVYPIYVDPTISLADKADTYTKEEFKDSNYGHLMFFRVQTQNGYRMRSYIKFELPNNITANQVTEGLLFLYRYDGTSSSRSIQLRDFADDTWGEYDLTWNTQPTTTNLIQGQTISSNGEVIYNNLRDAVKNNLADGKLSLCLQDSNEAESTKYDQWFYSYETAQGNYYIPKLNISYVDTLSDDTPTYTDLSSGDASFHFDISSGKWGVVGIRMIDGYDHDIYVYDNPDFENYNKASRRGSTDPDFVVVNGHTNSGAHYTSVKYNTGTAGKHARIEAQGSSTTRLSNGVTSTGTMNKEEVNDMYEAYFVSGKTYKVTLKRTAGSSDLDLYLFSKDVDYGNPATATMTSDNDNGAVDEVISYTQTGSGYVGIAVVHDGTSESSSNYANYEIKFEEVNSPPSTPSYQFPSNGAIDVSTSPLLQWTTSTDPDGDQVYYDVYLDQNSNPTTIKCQDITANSCSAGTLIEGTTYYWKVTAKDNKGGFNTGGPWYFTTLTSGGGGGNSDGDDLTDGEEANLPPVFDSNGNLFPDYSKEDAFYPTSAAELFYYKHYYNQPFESLRYMSYNRLIEDELTDNLGAMGLYLAKLLQSTDDPDLMTDIPPKLEKVLDQIMSRQVTDNIYFVRVGELGLYNMKGYINWKNSYQGPEYNHLNDFKTTAFGKFSHSFTRDENPSVTDAYAIQALLEGHLAFKDSSDPSLQEKATEYKDVAKLATDFLIAWHNSRGFNSDPDDVFFYSDQFLLPKLGFGYNDVAIDEKTQNAGDKYLGTVNIYGTSLNAISTLATVDPSLVYSNNMPIGTPDADGQSYSTIGNWMVDEIKRFQNFRDGREGGFRVGPLTKGQSGVRLQEQIHYSGFVAFGARQQYDNNNYGDSYTVITNLADHWIKIRDPHDDLGKRGPRGGGWFRDWDLDKKRPYQDRFEEVSNEWGAVIMLSGFEDQGFRQAMADMGGFLCSGSGMMNYVFYQAMKMEGDPNIVLPELSHPKCTPYTWMPAYSNPIIYPGEKREIGFKSDSTIGRLVATLEHGNCSSQLKFYLRNPSGDEINSNNYASFPGINYSINGTFEFYEVNSPTSGNWTLVLEPIEIPLEGEYYKMQATVGTTLNTLLETDSSSYAKGDSVSLITVMENQEETLTGATITGIVTDPTGRTYPVIFNDNGIQGDPLANDGFYTVVFPNTEKPGDYNVETTAKGTFNGEEYIRTASTGFYVMGYTDQASAIMSSMVYQAENRPGNTVNALFYIENTGTATIDDELYITIKDTTGHIKYKEEKNVVLYPDESMFIRVRWTIPEGTSPGFYKLKAEFDEVDSLPTIKGFEVQ